MKTKNYLRNAVLLAALTTAMLVCNVMPAMAAGWQKNDTGWWYGTNADNSTWYANEWQWIDGDGNGTAECYCFDANGYMYENTTTPDGYTVNADGAWTENGVVQIKAVAVTGSTGSTGNTGNTGSTGSTTGSTGTEAPREYSKWGVNLTAIEMLRNTREENRKYQEIYADGVEGNGLLAVRYANGFQIVYPQNTANWKYLFAYGDDKTLLFKYYVPNMDSGQEMEDYLLGLGIGLEHGYEKKTGQVRSYSKSCTISVEKNCHISWDNSIILRENLPLNES